MAQQVQDPALSLLWLGSLRWCRFSPWPQTFRMPGCRGGKKKKGIKAPEAAVSVRLHLAWVRPLWRVLRAPEHASLFLPGDGVRTPSSPGQGRGTSSEIQLVKCQPRQAHGTGSPSVPTRLPLLLPAGTVGPGQGPGAVAALFPRWFSS